MVDGGPDDVALDGATVLPNVDVYSFVDELLADAVGEPMVGRLGNEVKVTGVT